MATVFVASVSSENLCIVETFAGMTPGRIRDSRLVGDMTLPLLNLETMGLKSIAYSSIMVGQCFGHSGPKVAFDVSALTPSGELASSIAIGSPAPQKLMLSLVWGTGLNFLN